MQLSKATHRCPNGRRLTTVEIYYEVCGQGDPVLLVPASWWPSDTWNVGAVPLLSRRFKTVTLDCRGTGRSSKPKDGYTVEQFARDCIALLAYLGMSRCHAVGFALGGQIVQAMAIERPDLVATRDDRCRGGGSENTGRRGETFVARYGARDSIHWFRAVHTQLHRE